MRQLLLGYLRLPAWLRRATPWLLMAAIWWLSSQSRLPGGPGILTVLWHNGAHVVAYASLGAAWLLSFHRLGGLPRAGAAAAVLLAAAYGVVDELHQSHVPGRTSSVSDACSDCFGAAIGAALVLVLLAGSGRARAALPWLLAGACGSVALATWGPW